MDFMTIYINGHETTMIGSVYLLIGLKNCYFTIKTLSEYKLEKINFVNFDYEILSKLFLNYRENDLCDCHFDDDDFSQELKIRQKLRAKTVNGFKKSCIEKIINLLMDIGYNKEIIDDNNKKLLDYVIEYELHIVENRINKETPQRTKILNEIFIEDIANIIISY